jgi:hypothetical protein
MKLAFRHLVLPRHKSGTRRFRRLLPDLVGLRRRPAGQQVAEVCDCARLRRWPGRRSTRLSPQRRVYSPA